MKSMTLPPMAQALPARSSPTPQLMKTAMSPSTVQATRAISPQMTSSLMLIRQPRTMRPPITNEEEASAAGQQGRDQGSDAIDVLDSTNALETEEDFSTDPFLDATDQVFGDLDQVADEFGACSTTREALPVQTTTFIPEQRFCERIRKVDGNCTVTHDLRIDPATNTVIADDWGPSDCMIAASHAVGPSVCTGKVTLVQGAAIGECLDIDGVTICPGDPLYEQLALPPFDGKEQSVSRLAQTLEIGPLDCEANLTALPCITTSTGEEICPSDEGDIIDTCGGLRDDPACSFVSEGCAEGAEIDGVCYLQETQFTCDQEITFETFPAADESDLSGQ